MPVVTPKGEILTDSKGHPNTMERVPALDGVRGWAIVLVLLWHYVAMQLMGVPGTAVNLLRQSLGLCWSGVDLFFVLSGFLIGGILVDNRASANYFKSFYIRRTCRIFPLYYGWLLLGGMALAAGLTTGIENWHVSDVPLWCYFLYVQNIGFAAVGTLGSAWLGVTWSLAIEEQFYLLLPLFVRKVTPARLFYWLVVLVLLATVFRLACWYFLPHQGIVGYVLLPCRWDALLVGVIGALLVRNPAAVRAIRSNLWFIYALLGVIGAGLVILRVVKQGNLIYLGMHSLGFLWLAVFYLGVILIALHSTQRWVKWVFENRLIGRLGVVSYSVYLLHQPVSWLCHHYIWHAPPQMASMPRVFTTVLALGITLTLSALSWRYFESRFIALGRRFKY